MIAGLRNTPSSGSAMVAALAVERADTFFARLRGLVGRTALHADHALWLLPCGSVHTFGMRFSIDVVFLDRDQRVVAIRQALAPRRFAFARRARSVVELAAGQAGAQGLRPGDRWLHCACASDALSSGAGIAEARALGHGGTGSCTRQARGRGGFIRDAPVPVCPPSKSKSMTRRPALLAARLLIATLGAIHLSPAPAQSSAAAPSSADLPVSARVAARAAADPSTVEPDADRERAETDYRAQRYRSAAQTLRRLARADPNDARLWLRLGNALEQDGDPSGAVSAYESAAAVALPSQSQFGYLEARQRRGKALLNLARLWLLQSQQALAEYQRNRSAHREHGDVAAESSRHAGLLDEAIGRLAADAGAGAGQR